MEDTNDDQEPDLRGTGKDRIVEVLQNAKLWKYIGLGMSATSVALFAVLGILLHNAQKVVLESVKENTITTYVHDTVFVGPKTVYRCWFCKNELHLDSSGKAQCDGYEYKVVDGKLTATKIEDAEQQ